MEKNPPSVLVTSIRTIGTSLSSGAEPAEAIKGINQMIAKKKNSFLKVFIVSIVLIVLIVLIKLI
jgi:hypothetical protein